MQGGGGEAREQVRGHNNTSRARQGWALIRGRRRAEYLTTGWRRLMPPPAPQSLYFLLCLLCSHTLNNTQTKPTQRAVP